MTTLETPMAYPCVQQINLLLCILSTVVAIAGCAWFVLLHRKRSHLAEVATVGLFLIGLICSFVGSAKLSVPQYWWDAWLTALQFVVLNVPPRESDGLAYGIARIALPLAMVGLFLSALLRRGEQWFLRLRFWRAPTLLVLGSGKTGRRLASVLRRANPQLRALAVDEAIDSKGALAWSGLGIRVLEGSVETSWVSDTLQSPRIDMVLVCTEDDALDYATARRVAALLPSNATASIVVCSDSSELAGSCQLDPVMSTRYDSGQLQFTSSTAFDARLLLQRYPPHLIVDRSFGLDSPRPCHIAVQGAGALVPMLIAQAARTLVYPLHRLKISVFVKDAAKFRRQCFERFPALSPAAALRADAAYGGQTPVADVEFFEPTVRDWRAVHELSPIDVVYVVGDSNQWVSRATLDVLKMVNAIDAQLDVVAVFHPDELGDESAHRDRLLELHNRCAHNARLHVFWRYEWDLQSLGIALDRSTPSSSPTLPYELMDEIAKRVWLHYKISQKEPAELTGWRRAPDQERWWNRHAADHAAIKLKLFEGTLPKGATVDAYLSKHTIPDWLAELEHRRYVCERMVDGWLRVDGEKLSELCLNPTLVDYHQLGPDEKVKDVEAVLMQLTAALEAREGRAAVDLAVTRAEL